jgi:hypothetical protein
VPLVATHVLQASNNNNTHSKPDEKLKKLFHQSMTSIVTLILLPRRQSLNF